MALRPGAKPAIRARDPLKVVETRYLVAGFDHSGGSRAEIAGLVPK